MSNRIGIVGGDLRIAKLSEILADDNYIVYTYGLEKYKFTSDNITKCNNLKDIVSNCDSIISGMPFSKDGLTIYAPFSNNELIIEKVLEELKNKVIIAGAVKQEIKEMAYKNNTKFIDLMEDETLTILNIIPTVEGAIQTAMENTEITIYNSNCLVLGFGRIGKLLSKNLKELGANVSCMARKEKDLAWSEVYGYKAIELTNLDKNLDNYDIIFNTVPSLILDDKKLKLLKGQNTLIIELASSPGGIDFKKAEEYDIKVIKALGLPGKVAPITAAKYIKKTLEKILNKKEN